MKYLKARGDDYYDNTYIPLNQFFNIDSSYFEWKDFKEKDKEESNINFKIYFGNSCLQMEKSDDKYPEYIMYYYEFGYWLPIKSQCLPIKTKEGKYLFDNSKKNQIIYNRLSKKIEKIIEDFLNSNSTILNFDDKVERLLEKHFNFKYKREE